MKTKALNLTTTDPIWAKHFASERSLLASVLPDARIEHIGSTAVPGLVAKPVVDILLGVVGSSEITAVEPMLLALGYVAEGQRPGHHWLCRPSPKHRLINLHVVVAGEGEWIERLAFRNLLRSDPVLATEYAALKQKLLELYPADLGAYTTAKWPFVASALGRSA